MKGIAPTWFDFGEENLVAVSSIVVFLQQKAFNGFVKVSVGALVKV